MALYCYLLLCLTFLPFYRLLAQDRIDSVSKISSKYISAVHHKAGKMEVQLDSKNQRVLALMEREDKKIKEKLYAIDSVKAKEIFESLGQQYTDLTQRISKRTSSIKHYIPELDSLGTSIRFLQQKQELLSNVKPVKAKISETLSRITNIESEFQKAYEIKSFLRNRQEYLTAQLSELGFVKELRRINKEFYYYSAQLNEYKSILKDRKKIEIKALELLSKSKAFRSFMEKNGQLASLFRLPGTPDNLIGQSSLAGLQTRAQVNTLVQQQLGAGGPNATAAFQQNLQQGQAMLNELKSKVSLIDGANPEVGMPEGFIPNPQRTKRMLDRIELGINMQTQKGSYYLPVQTDIGLSVGYKLNRKSIIGFGASYRMGWGKDIRHIRITHQGVTVRGFADYKIKGTFWITGGYEMIYQSSFRKIVELRTISAWQRSGLLGVSKVVTLKSNLLKKTKIQLLWDFLSYNQVPQTQPILFRIEYGF